ncbi:hypothetical protein BDP27DRAFT_1320016 [Rhodocollybia butyracea]|uniref:Uncharacterized protein n=1 Tax=Rhodocollybia butyracea TaxID=206335 RepID=A0A9P5PUS2_9AGAR|nr:hypothetical protein BDP27DRAFT_1320016 [Rhodocollybia butyracea]
MGMVMEMKAKKKILKSSWSLRRAPSTFGKYLRHKPGILLCSMRIIPDNNGLSSHGYHPQPHLPKSLNPH